MDVKRKIGRQSGGSTAEGPWGPFLPFPDAIRRLIEGFSSVRTDLDAEDGEATLNSVVQEFKDRAQDIRVRVFGIAESRRLAFSDPVVHAVRRSVAYTAWLVLSKPRRPDSFDLEPLTRRKGVLCSGTGLVRPGGM